MKLLDSRRLTGANLLLEGPGVVIDIAADADVVEALVPIWRRQAGAMLERLAWGEALLRVRRFDGGASLGFAGPIDALYAGTEVNEWALEAADAARRGTPPPDADRAATRLAAVLAAERNPSLLALQQAARERDATFLWCDDFATVGLGVGSQTWPVDAIPEPTAIDWDTVHDIPVVLVTGTNGKSTAVRLLAQMVASAGRVPGLSTTDWIRVGDEALDTGDYSGPGGARAVLRDRRTEVGILETARGGMLRRGLGVERADAAVVLNVAEDHLGEWGIGDLAGLTEVKFLVAKALGDGGTLVLNADEPPVLARGQRFAGTKQWFGLDPTHPQLRAAEAAGEDSLSVEAGQLTRRHGPARVPLLEEARAPLTLGGRARFNTSNALAACALAGCIGLPVEAIVAGLATFESTPEANPGRGNLFEIDGATVLADFAHNPHGMRALFELASAYAAPRMAVLLGQAGDRTDEDVRALVACTAAAKPDLILVKAMDEHLRGRAPGEMTALIQAELERAGVDPARIEHASSELAAAKRALAWSEPGDLLLLLLHAQRGAVLAHLADAARS